MNNHEIFLNAITEKKILRVTFNSKEKGEITRLCIPFDFWPSRRNLKENPDRYHFYDLDSPEGNHTLSILPEQLVLIETTGEYFEPSDYVNWTPNWFVSRDWGDYS